MPEEIVEKTTEETEPKESEEVEKKETEETEEEVEKTIPQKEEDEDDEPKKRFPVKEQTAEEKRLAYKLRQAEKLLREKAPDEDVDLEDEDEKPVTRKELNELLEKKDKESASEKMLQEFLSDNPDFKKYEKKIRKHVNDPDYANVPIGFIASGIVGENLDAEANERAEAKTKADAEAAKTKSGGSVRRGIPGKKKNVWDMSKEEFEEHQSNVLKNQ
jgi:hypothetical protein